MEKSGSVARWPEVDKIASSSLGASGHSELNASGNVSDGGQRRGRLSLRGPEGHGSRAVALTRSFTHWVE